MKLSLRSTLNSTPANEEEIINNSIDLAARLYLMVNIGVNESSVLGEPVIWTDGNLKDLLATHFKACNTLGSTSTKLEPTFKACHLEKIAGINIEWTDNLADHLRLIDDGDEVVVTIFHHASYLKRQQRYEVQSGLEYVTDTVQRALSTRFYPGDIGHTRPAISTARQVYSEMGPASPSFRGS